MKPCLLIAESVEWKVEYTYRAGGDDDADDDKAKRERILTLARERFEKFLRVVPSHDYGDDGGAEDAATTLLRGIRITLSSTNATLAFGVDESYNLTADCGSKNYIDIEAATVYGSLYAIETLKQLLNFSHYKVNNKSNEHERSPGAATEPRGDALFAIPSPLSVRDAPEYGYRGLLIDTARHYLNLETVLLPNLYVMASLKLNALHWHLTDRESFAWQSRRHPELAEQGKLCDNCVYTDDDVRTIVQTAADLGIRVVVEVDLPGHAKVVGKSHPELMSHCSGQAGDVIDPTNNDTLRLVRDVYEELGEIFPDSWMHVGADEVKVDCWKEDPKIQAWIRENGLSTTTQLLSRFVNQLVDIVATDLGRRPIIWEDPFVSGVQLENKDIIIDCWQMWRMASSVQEPLKAGFDILVSGCWYLDHLDQDWWKFYGCNPRGFVTSQADKEKILGGHASMWGEKVDDKNFFERVYPRASSMAEVLWAGGAPTQQINKQSVANRLDAFRCYLVTQFGIPASPIKEGTGHCEAADSSERLAFFLAGVAVSVLGLAVLFKTRTLHCSKYTRAAADEGDDDDGGLEGQELPVLRTDNDNNLV